MRSLSGRLALTLDAPAAEVERVLRDMSERPDEYGMRAERRPRRGIEEWRLVS